LWFGIFLPFLFFLLNPWDSVTENIPTKIDREAINFGHPGGKKVEGCVDGKTTHVTMDFLC